ncbi:HD domain-containing protein [Candidatus Micrarchaeota archaeon]|nr:HD domain-containing protein [Candidatus Micrarchaeota archaeon]
MDNVISYLFESGQLKRQKRSGWQVIGIKDPESVAEHSFRTAIVAFFLAKMENLNSHKLASAAVFHDMLETRITDLHKVAARYIEVDEQTERKVIDEQTAKLPIELRKEILSFQDLNQKEKIVLKDADQLECAIQAKEYLEIGYKEAQDWLNNIEKRLKSNSARLLMEKLKASNSNDWWRGLKKLD